MFADALAPKVAEHLASLAAAKDEPPTGVTTKKLAAERLRISPSTLNREIAAGRLRPTRVGSRVLITEAEIARYIADVR